MPPAPSPTALRALRHLAFPRPFTPACMPRHTTATTTPYICRPYHTTPPRNSPPPPPPPTNRTNRRAPRTHDRGPKSTESTQTDFAAMDIFNSSSTPSPNISIDACVPDGFHLSSGIKTDLNDESRGKALILLGGEAFWWDPSWSSSSSSSSSSSNDSKAITDISGGGSSSSSTGLIDKRGLLHLPPTSLKLLTHIHPLPDLLLIGTGARLLPLHPATRQFFTQELGVRVDVMDTANASAAYNLLATERGTGEGGVGGVFFGVGWRG